MPDREKVIKGLEICSEYGSWHGLDCELNEVYKDCPYRGCETGCVVTIAKDALTLLKEQEEVEATINEDYEIFCGNCGENVGIIGRSVNLKVCSNYCPSCGKKVKRPKKWYET